MSVHLITMEKGHKVARPIVSRQEYLRLRNTSAQQANLRMARQGSRGAKMRLVQMNYSCLPNADGTLKGATTPSNTVGMDVDFDPASPHYERLMAEAPQTILAKKDELGLLMLERSVTKGYHLVFRRRKELSNEANLQWASDLLGVAFDKGAKDLTRVFFTTSASPSDLLFLHDDLFAMGACENVERAAHDTPTPTAKASEGASGEVTQPQARTYKGVPYSQIIHRWFALTGGEPTLGERNVRLYQLAAALRAICDNDPQLLLAVVPSYGLPNEEMHAILQSACKEQPKGLSKTLRAAIEQAKRATLEADEADEQSTTQPTRQRAPEAFAMSRLPPALRASLKGVPENMWWPVIAAVMPIAAAYADGVTVEYCDGARQRLALMSIILGDQASGKSVCKKAVDLWKRQLDREDQERANGRTSGRPSGKAARPTRRPPTTRRCSYACCP